MKRKLVDHLVNRGVVSRKDVQRCVLRANMNEASVVDEMTERLDIDEQKLASVMADFWGFELWGRASVDLSPAQVESISREEATKYGVLPVDGGDDVFRIAVYDVEKARPIIEKIRSQSGIAPTVVVAPRQLVEDKVAAHYKANGAKGAAQVRGRKNPGRRRSTGHGVVRKKKKGRKRTTRPGKKLQKSSSVSGEPSAPVSDAQPTRQVELATDNPFMDLVQQTADDREPDPSPSESSATGAGLAEVTASQDEAPESHDEAPASQDDEVDFFGDFGDDSEFDAIVEESWSSVAESVDEPDPGAGEPETEGDIGDVEKALEQFDTELGNESSVDEPSPLSSSAAVNWGEYEDGTPATSSGGGGSRPDGRGLSGNRPRSESGIFPVSRSQSRLFNLPSEADDEQLTLAEVVDRQRNLIEKLEREIDYQKGILQTMAELLVESRVLSRKKLKQRLKAFKEEQRKKYE